MLCLWLAHSRGGARRGASGGCLAPPSVRLPFFYVQVFAQTHGEARGGGRRAAAWRPPPCVSPFFISKLDLEVSRRAAGRRRVRQGWGTGRLPSPSLSHASSAVCLWLKKIIKKNWDYRRLEIAPGRLRGTAAVGWPRARCSFPAGRQSLPPLGASELFS